MNSLISNKGLVDILRRLVKIPTENPPGKTDKIIEYLISEVFTESEGFQNEIITYKKKNIELSNLVTKIGTGKEKIILSGHFDVVPPGNYEEWKHPPFSADIVDGKLYGRGSADMKAGLTMLIGTMKKLKEYTKFLKKYSLVFLGTADEEAGMTGALTSARKGVLRNSILLIIGEPTNMNIGIAEKGLLWANLEIYGKSAHGSTPYMGINSIEGALKLIPQLYNCLDDFENEILGSSTINIGKIEGGTTINIVPNKTIMQVDFRLIPEQDVGRLIKKLKDIKLSPCSLKVVITFTLPSLQTDTKFSFVQNLKKITNRKFIGLPYATDSAVLVDSKNPVPFVIYGPGDPAVVHRENEHVKIEDVYEATNLLTKALLQTYLKD
ncbi:MAG: M20 family metallopeptidase [Candidatus Hodarchaeota archaeon]